MLSDLPPVETIEPEPSKPEPSKPEHEIYRPQPFIYDTTNKYYLFFDIFYKNGIIYFIAPIYKQHEPNHHNVILRINNKVISKYRLHRKECYEAIQVFMYKYSQPLHTNNKDTNEDKANEDKTNEDKTNEDMTNEDMTNKILVSVSYKNLTKTFLLPHIQTQKKEGKELVLTTLFKDDYKIIPLFHNYYKKQGVEHFYLYFNGPVTNTIREIVQPYNDVTLIEWDFRYWNVKNPTCYFTHHAQMGQLHHALYYYGKQLNKFMIFCDLDEYFHMKHCRTLMELVKTYNNRDVFIFLNCWAKTENNQIPMDGLPNKLIISNPYPYKKRSKCIYKTSEINLIGIHHPYLYSKAKHLVKMVTGNIFFHFYNWTNSIRKSKNIKYKFHRVIHRLH